MLTLHHFLDIEAQVGYDGRLKGTKLMVLSQELVIENEIEDKINQIFLAHRAITLSTWSIA